MYKTISKRMQRKKENTSPSIPDNDAINKYNERRCPFFFILYQASKQHIWRRTCPISFPEWLRKEIHACGGVDGWVRKNFYWQKWYRQILYKTFMGARELGSSVKEPKWFRKEIKKIGLSEWLKIFLVQKDNHITQRNGIKTIIVRNGKKVTSVLNKAERTTSLPEKDTNAVLKSPSVIVKHKLITQKLQEKNKVKQRKKKRKKRISEDAMFHSVSGGGFETNRSRH